LGKVQVKGKKDAIAVYEILDGDAPEIAQLKIETREDFEEGLGLYFRKDFTAAASIFKKITNINPKDLSAQLYLKNSARFMVEGVPDDWQGIEAMDSK